MKIKLKNKILIICAFFFIYAPIFSQENTENININSDSNCKNINILERPYSLLENYPKKDMIRINTGIFAAGAIGTMGILYLMPESVTGWNKSSLSFKNLFGKWKDNVVAGPVFDKDNWFLNYAAHPYCGAVYYMDARSVGYNAIYSFLHCVGMSTFMWEYGIEAFAEIPSINDLIITPIAGSIIGELFYLIKREIAQNDWEIFNSKIIGHTITFLIDPINEIANLLVPEKSASNLILQPNYVGLEIKWQIP